MMKGFRKIAVSSSGLDAAMHGPTAPSDFSISGEESGNALSKKNRRHVRVKVGKPKKSKATTPKQQEKRLNLKKAHGLEAFKSFITEALIIAREDPKTDKSSGTALMQNFRLDMDRLFPFRELGTSRKLMSKAGEPYDHPRTRESIFSIALFRGITFGAPILFSAPRQYDSLEEWNATVEQHKHQGVEGFLYLSKAYGVPNAARNPVKHPEVAKKYWEASASWEKLIGKGLLDFETCLKYFRDSKDKNNAMLWPHIGPLTAVLLTEDLSYSDPSLVKPPTVNDMGKAIYDLQLGARDALVYMGLIGNKATLAETQEAFQEVYDFVNEAFSEEDKMVMRFDAIMVEHALCKFKRAKKTWNSYHVVGYHK